MRHLELLQEISGEIISKTDAGENVEIFKENYADLKNKKKIVSIRISDANSELKSELPAIYEESLSVYVDCICLDDGDVFRNVDDLASQVLAILSPDPTFKNRLKSFYWERTSVHWETEGEFNFMSKQIVFEATITHTFHPIEDLTDLHGLDAAIQTQPDQGQERLAVKVDY